MSSPIYFEQSSRHNLHDPWDITLINILVVIQVMLISAVLTEYLFQLSDLFSFILKLLT